MASPDSPVLPFPGSAPVPPEPVADLARLDAATGNLLRARARRRWLAWTLAVPAISLPLLVAFDATAAPEPAARVVGVALAVVAAIACLVLALRRPPPIDALAAAEAALGEDDRRLTAAQQLGDNPDPRARAHAVVLAAALGGEEQWLPRLRRSLPPARAWPAMALGGGALAALAVAALTWPGLIAVCLPRLWDPFGDHPPYSATHLRWVDPPLVAVYNEPVTLTVAVSGPQPENLLLHVQGDGVEATAETHLLPAGENRWKVRLEPPTSPLRLWVAGAGTRTTWLDLPLDGVPRLRRASATLVQPAYANLPDVVARREARATTLPPELSALPGSRLRLELACSRMPEAVWLQRQDGTQAAGTAERRAGGGRPPAAPGQDAGATVVIDDPGPGTWSISLEGPDGTRGSPLAVVALSRRTDAPPTARIIQPEDGAYATPDSAVPLQIQASDDLGLARLTTYRLIGDRQVSEDRHTLGGTGDTWRGQARLSGVKPGDVVRFGAVVRDTCPPDGQLSAPAEVSVTIIALDRFLQMAQDQLDEQALMMRFEPLFAKLSALEEEARRLAAEPPSAERTKKLQELEKKLAETRAEFAAQAATTMSAADGEVFQALDERLAELQREAAKGFPDGSGKDQAKELSQDLDQLTAEAQAEAVEDWVADLAKAERRIADELKDLGANQADGTSDQQTARVRELARQQREMEQALQELQGEAAVVAERLGPGNPGLAEHMEQVAKALGETGEPAGRAAREASRGQPGRAAPPADDTAKRLAALVAKRQTGKGQGQGEGQKPGQGQGKKPGWCNSDKLSQARAQLAALAKRGMGKGGSPGGTGGGALGSFGGGAYVRRGGDAPRGPTGKQIYGPLATLPPRGGGRVGASRQPAGGAADPGRSGTNAPTPYEQGVRTTTAGIGASLTPQEEAVVDDYYRRLAQPEGAGGGTSPPSPMPTAPKPAPPKPTAPGGPAP